VGAAVAYGGFGILNLAGLKKIFIALLTSPIFGIFIGFYFMKLILKLFGSHSPGVVNRHFGRLQIISSGFMAFSHGSNDAQKVMGIITLSLVSGGYLTSLEVPLWVIILCATAMGFGTALGGWRVIKTLGVHMLKLEPVHGFAAETAATAVILGASAMHHGRGSNEQALRRPVGHRGKDCPGMDIHPARVLLAGPHCLPRPHVRFFLGLSGPLSDSLPRLSPADGNPRGPRRGCGAVPAASVDGTPSLWY
jgi:hypothetical protein